MMEVQPSTLNDQMMRLGRQLPKGFTAYMKYWTLSIAFKILPHNSFGIITL